jgi:uncharacterized protein
MNSKYMSRIVDEELKMSLESSGAVLIEGAKWCGKTRTAKEFALSVLEMQNPDQTQAYLKAADTKPSLLLQGDTPRLLDEWQIAPVLWDAVRYEVDHRSKNGQFIMTGSSVPTNALTRHTGAGRISRIQMRPMSLFESSDSNGEISLRSLFNGNTDIAALSSLTIEKLAFCIVRGGWPNSISVSENAASKIVIDYVENIITSDISRVDENEKNPMIVRALMKSLARNISTQANMRTLKADIQGNGDSISDKTISSYLNALTRIFIVEQQHAWSPSMRSKTALRVSPKWHYVDPSIATAVLRVTPNSLLNDFNSFGYLFESLCVRDLRIYAQANDGDVYHFLDKNGYEIDAIIQLRDGRWGAIEVKMGSKEIEKAALNLLRLNEKVDFSKMNPPSFLMVLTGTQAAYKREDGVLIVPIGCLKD